MQCEEEECWSRVFAGSLIPGRVLSQWRMAHGQAALERTNRQHAAWTAT